MFTPANGIGVVRMPDAPMSNPIVCDVVNAEELGPAVPVPYMSPASQTLPPAPPNVRVVVLPARPNPDMSARPDIPVEYGDLNDEVSNPPNSSSSSPPVVAHSEEDEVEPEAGPDGASFKLTDLPNADARSDLLSVVPSPIADTLSFVSSDPASLPNPGALATRARA